MNLFDLLAEVRRLGGCLAVEEGKLHYRGPREGLTPELRHAISQQKDELLSVLAQKDSYAWFWPPHDAVELVVKWNQLEHPQIPLYPGVSIANLETWLCSPRREDRVSDQLGIVRRFLWEGLPKTEVPLTNPLLEVADLEAVVEFSRRHGLVSVIDNTFASPLNFRPLEHGFDVEVHSGTKYLNGHADIVAGCVIGTAEMVARIVHKLNHLGGTLDPHACFLLNRGLKTLALRVRQQNANGQALAEFLQGHQSVQRVNYPGLPDHPQHERASRLFEGCCGVVSFELSGGAPAAAELLRGLELAIVAPSLGGVETLVSRPALTSHAGVPPETRAALGITDGLVRVAVGIESIEDLCADFGRALAALS